MEPVTCEIKNNELVISFPKEFSGKNITGEGTLYCPSDEDNDATQKCNIVDAPLIGPIPSVKINAYEWHLTWHSGELNYYFDKKIFIAKG